MNITQDTQERPLLLPVKEAARLLGIKKTLLYEMAARGDILKVKVGGRALVPRAEVERIATGK